MIFILIGIFLLMIGVELPHLIKNKFYKEIGVFLGFLIIGIILSLLNFYNIAFTNPFESLAYILEKRS